MTSHYKLECGLLSLILKFPNVGWNWYALSANPNITFDIVRSNPECPWNWNGLSRNPNLTVEEVKNNPNERWDRYFISHNNFGIVNGLYKVHRDIHTKFMRQVCLEIEFAPEGTFGSRMQDGGIEWQKQKEVFSSV